MILKKIDFILSLFIMPIAYTLPFFFIFRNKSSKTLIVRPGGMGDLIILILSMKKNGIDPHEYSWLIEKRSEVWAEYLGIEYSCYDRSPIKTLFLHAGRYRNVLNTEQFFGLAQMYSKMCTCISGNLLSFKTNRYSFISNDKVQYNPTTSHEIIEFSKFFNGNSSLKNYLSTSDKNINSNYCILWVAGSNSPSRSLEISHYEKLAEIVNNKFLYIVSGPNESELAENIYKKLSENRENIELFQGKFQDSCELLKDAFCLLSIDSSPTHLASYFNVVSYSIFTSGLVRKWHPLSTNSYIFRNNELECSPCTLFGQLPPCLNSYQCKEVNFSSPIKVEEFVNNF